MEQLNKIQLKAEILTVISKLQMLSDISKVDEVIAVLVAQEDKKLLLDLLMREFVKTTEDKSFIISFLLLKLTDKTQLENALWTSLKSPMISDYNKALILSLLRDMGNKVDYNEIDNYFEDSESLIEKETNELLNTAMMNPEAQIDFLDFLENLPYEDKLTLVQSLGEDYSEDALANILIPVFLKDPTSKIGQIALKILGTSKSQLALHALQEALEYADDDIIPEIKRNISSLKLSGIREDSAIDFYKELLSETKPYECYTNYPDGHGNQAIILSRINKSGKIQFVAIVIDDYKGIRDCFGFNEISKFECNTIIERFYRGQRAIELEPEVLKTILINAEKLLVKFNTCL